MAFYAESALPARYASAAARRVTLPEKGVLCRASALYARGWREEIAAWRAMRAHDFMIWRVKDSDRRGISEARALRAR